jgi:hypothetical protein
MSEAKKERKTDVEMALDAAQNLRRRIVNLKLDRYEESPLLDKASDIMRSIERATAPKEVAQEGGDADGK